MSAVRPDAPPRGGNRCRAISTWLALGGLFALAILLAGVSTVALAGPDASPDPRDVRIRQLQDEVQKLVYDHQRLKAEDEQFAAKTRQLESEVAALQQRRAAQSEANLSQTIQTIRAEEPGSRPAPTRRKGGRQR